MKQINSPDAKRIKNKRRLEEHLYLSRADYDSRSLGMTGFVCQAHALFRKQVTGYNQLVHALSCFVLLSYKAYKVIMKCLYQLCIICLKIMLSVLLILFQLLPPLLHQIADEKQHYHFDLNHSDTEFRVDWEIG